MFKFVFMLIAMIHWFSSMLIVLALLFSHTVAKGQQPIPFDSIRLEISNAQNEKSRIDALLNLGSAFYKQRMADSLYFYSQRIDTTSIYGLGARHYLTGLGHYREMKLRAAIVSLEKACSILINENRKAFFSAMMPLGVSYLRTNQPEKAKKTYLQMLDQIGEENSPFKPGVYGNLGMAYRNLGDYDNAIVCFEKCVELKPEDAFGVANSYMNIGTMFLRLEMYDKAITTLKQVDTTTISNTPIYIALNVNLGENYYKSGNYKLAKQHFNLARSKAKVLDQYHLNVNPNIFLAKLALRESQFAEAEERTQEAFEAVKKSQILRQL